MKPYLYIVLLFSISSCNGQNNAMVKIHKMPTTKKQFHISTKNEDRLIPFHNAEGQWGYMDAKTDSIVVQPRYSGAKLFADGIAKVYQPNPESKHWNYNLLRGFIDTQGRTIFKPQFIGVYDVEIRGNRISKDSLSDLRTVYKNDGTKGVISLKAGQWLFSVKKDVRIYFYDRTHFVVNYQTFFHNGKETVLPSKVSVDWVYFSPNFIKVKNKAGASGLYSWEGKKIIAPNYLDLSIDSASQRIVASRLRGGSTLGNLRRLLSQGNENALNVKVDLFDFHGNKIKTYKSKYQADMEEEGMGSFESNGKTTYFSLKTGKIIKEREKVIKALPDGYELFRQNDKAGLRSADGTIIIPAEYRNIFYIDSSHIITQTKDYYYNLYDKQGNKQLEKTYSQLNYIPDLKRFLVSIDGSKYGQIDSVGEVVIPILYDGFSSLALQGNPPYAVSKDYKYGILDKNGKTLAPFIYDRIRDTRRSDSTKVPFFIMTKDSKVGLMDQDGKWLVPMKYESISKSNDLWFRLTTSSGNERKHGLFNVKTKTLILLEYSNIRMYKDFIIAVNREDNTYFYQLLDFSGHLLNDKVYTQMELTHGYLLCRRNGKYGILNTQGKIVIPFDYKYIWTKTDTLIYVKTENDDTYYMDISGKAYKDPKG